jgi:hypothetical protein
MPAADVLPVSVVWAAALVLSVAIVCVTVVIYGRRYNRRR